MPTSDQLKVGAMAINQYSVAKIPAGMFGGVRPFGFGLLAKPAGKLRVKRH